MCMGTLVEHVYILNTCTYTCNINLYTHTCNTYKCLACMLGLPRYMCTLPFLSLTAHTYRCIGKLVWQVKYASEPEINKNWILRFVDSNCNWMCTYCKKQNVQSMFSVRHTLSKFQYLVLGTLTWSLYCHLEQVEHHYWFSILAKNVGSWSHDILNEGSHVHVHVYPAFQNRGLFPSTLIILVLALMKVTWVGVQDGTRHYWRGCVLVGQA